MFDITRHIDINDAHLDVHLLIALLECLDVANDNPDHYSTHQATLLRFAQSLAQALFFG